MWVISGSLIFKSVITWKIKKADIYNTKYS